MVANGELRDGSNHKPHFSLRSLCRALVHAGALYAVYGLHRSIFEGFSMSFLTQLDQPSHTAVAKLLDAVLLDASSKSQLKILPKCPSALLEDDHRRGEEHVAVFEYWLTIGAQAEPVNPADYILTPTIENHLRGVTRAVASGRFPILLQGPTSSGKTSMVTYLAARTGHRLIRINNHEHTDIQEYIGSYMADSSGRLVFTHGALVQAVKHGYWIVLDELNLAPTDVLEALNRLLDDNRELYIPETQETIRAHPDFMLFATQNPPGSYGGRKVLSRAFRNRFIELHFGNIPNPELEIILRDRSKIPASLSKKLIKILKKLQVLRTSSNLFAGKEGFITLRDLFRWAERYKQQQVATETLAQAQQRVEAVVPEPPTKRNRRDEHPTLATFFDHNMALACDGYMLLAERARRPEDQAQIRAVIEQVLGVEINLETLYSGSISPLYQAMQQQMVHASDPTHLLFPFRHVVWTKAMRRMFCMVERCLQVNEPVLLVGETGTGKTTVCQIIAILLSRNLRYLSCHQNTETSDFLGGLRPVRTTVENTDEPSRLFEWHDGPLIEAMRQGDLFLMDEISLADDSVLERLNSVLETSRQLVLAERGGTDSVETVTAHECFAILATMNPGGDFGKKELSPALRNRFTEMWIPAVTDQQDLLDIVSHALVTEDDRCVQFAQSILDFPLWLTTSLHFTQAVSLRDYLAWARFIASSVATIGPAAAFVHGGCLVFVDGLEDRVEGSNVTVRQHAVAQLLSYLDTAGQQAVVAAGLDDGALVPTLSAGSDAEYGMAPFYISTGKVA
jgi:midasin (ATPase involved in ribosome maturation)